MRMQTRRTFTVLTSMQQYFIDGKAERARAKIQILSKEFPTTFNSFKVSKCRDGQVFPCFMNSKIHCGAYMNPPEQLTLIHFNTIYIFSKIYFNISLAFISSSPQLFSPIKVSDQNCMCSSHSPHAQSRLVNITKIKRVVLVCYVLIKIAFQGTASIRDATFREPHFSTT
jgi:hypothetical protein